LCMKKGFPMFIYWYISWKKGQPRDPFGLANII